MYMNMYIYIYIYVYTYTHTRILKITYSNNKYCYKGQAPARPRSAPRSARPDPRPPARAVPLNQGCSAYS